ncbi:DUF4349 domain-containing protein [Streptomyces polygonati]|uniref:DUF4349 domain-containing protein n=1 Tax=Streptomyces polygonati TaxID=1617087 RepID=A0ABV8HVE4_9ACTN
MSEFSGSPALPAGRRDHRRRRRGRPAAVCAVLLAAALTVAGCGASDHADSSAGSAAKAPAAARDDAGTTAAGPGGAPGTGTGASTAGPGTVPASPAYLARTADLSVRTPHVERQLDRARSYVAEAGGYAGDETTSVDAAGRTSSTVQLRVPPAGYDRVLTELAGLGTLTARTVRVEDVTGQVVDVGSRIKSQQASLVRLRALMDRAQQLSAIVSLESELTTRESDLEALEAQQASLRSQTALATVTLRLSEPQPRPAPPERARHDGFWGSVGHALGNGWHAFFVTLRVALVVLSAALPFLAVLGLGWFGYRVVRRRRPGPLTRPSLRPPGGGPDRAGEHAETPLAFPLPRHPAESGRERVPQPEEPPADE